MSTRSSRCKLATMHLRMTTVLHGASATRNFGSGLSRCAKVANATRLAVNRSGDRAAVSRRSTPTHRGKTAPFRHAAVEQQSTDDTRRAARAGRVARQPPSVSRRLRARRVGLGRIAVGDDLAPSGGGRANGAAQCSPDQHPAVSGSIAAARLHVLNCRISARSASACAAHRLLEVFDLHASISRPSFAMKKSGYDVPASTACQLSCHLPVKWETCGTHDDIDRSQFVIRHGHVKPLYGADGRRYVDQSRDGMKISDVSRLREADDRVVGSVDKAPDEKKSRNTPRT